MLLSKSCVYGLRASLLLASISGDDYVTIKELSEGLSISYDFLTKILQQLTSSGIMKTKKGPKGGIKLAKPAEAISLLQIVKSIDGIEQFEQCLLGLPGCGTEEPCPMHDWWSAKQEEITNIFETTNLLESADDLQNGSLRISENGNISFEEPKPPYK